MSALEDRKRRLDMAIERQSGASDAEAKRIADENERYEREKRRRGMVGAMSQSPTWGDTINRFLGRRK